MQTLLRRGPLLAGLACLVLLTLIVTRKPLPDLSILTAFPWANFKTIFISIILEAIPFVLLGVLFSALLQVFVSEQTIRRWTPRNPVLGVVFACTLGLIFPLCECGMIPIVRRLMRKGMPVYIAVTFILAGPVLNPVVYASTYMAFRSRPEMAYSRMGLAFVVAAAIGLYIYAFVKRNPLRGEPGLHAAPSTALQPGSGNSGSLLSLIGTPRHEHADGPQHQHHHHHDHQHEHHNHHDHHHHDHGHAGAPRKTNRLLSTLSHASDEFFEMGKYLIFGAMLTGIIQAVVARESLVAVGQGDWSSHLFMMGFAYVLSLCSTSDAFVASSFATTFTSGSLLTFLVFGPMIDLKNTLMLMSVFRIRFILMLTALVAVVVLIGARALELLVL
ncbi:permease [Paenibacillus oceani]|uniref:Permease n=1 Tax=Paenibacillus oceani TaxID=2772510 RepID=A0A927GZK8_9BACL|nr:permease [Paenibacillus oceani]MBD2861574.1 permease [Paenibacillus oceani]